MGRGRTSAFILAVVLLAVACKEEGTIKVSSLTFTGNKAFSARELKAIIATQATGRLPWSRPHFFDRKDFETDLKRIEQFYRENGYTDARVVSFDAQLHGESTIALKVTISEGEPTRVRSVAFEGFNIIPSEHLTRLRGLLPLQPGQIQKEAQIKSSRDLALRELQDHGYAHAVVESRQDPVAGTHQVNWTLIALPGPLSHFGPVDVAGNVGVGEQVIRRELAFKSGDLFNLGTIRETQRRLYNLSLFQYANVEPRVTDDDPEIPVRITVAEGKPRQLQGSVGYGSEEKARAEIGWRHRNFLGDARNAGFEARWSSLDRGVRANFEQPFFLGVRESLAVTGQSWFLREPAYSLDTRGGRVALNRNRSNRDPITGLGVTTFVSVSAGVENESFAITSAALADLTIRDQLIALGLDPRTGAGHGTLVNLAVDLRRDTTTNLLDARHGYIVSSHLEQAGLWLPGDYNYVEVTGEARHYLQLTKRLVWANRVRLGDIQGRGSSPNVPFFKRYFLGGSNSLRGWGRFDVAPLSPSGLPIGGLSMLEMSTEARVAAFGKVGLVAFLDAGNVWPDSWRFHFGDLRADVGPGVRYDTPVGPARFDVGFQLTPIEGLIVQGKPETRHWRMHFSIGHSF